MRKNHPDTAKFPTDNKGRLLDPFTGELLVPVKELQEAAKQIPEEKPTYLPDDKAHWLSGNSLNAALKTGVTHKISEILRELINNPNTTVASNDGREILASKAVGWFINPRNYKSDIFVDPNITSFLEITALGAPILPKDKKHWLCGNSALSALGMYRGNIAILENALSEFLDKSDTTISLKGSDKIPASSVIGRYRNGTKISMYFDPKITNYVAELVGHVPKLEPHREHWVSGSKALKEIGVKYSTALKERMLEACRKLSEKSPNEEISFTDPETGAVSTWKIEDVIVKRSHWGNSDFYFDPQIAPFIREQMGLLAIRTSSLKDWVSGDRACALLGIHPSATNIDKVGRACKKLLTTGGSYEISNHEGEAVNVDLRDFIKEFTGGLYFDPTCVDLIRNEMELTPKLPSSSKHWISANKACIQIGIAPTKHNAQAVREICKEHYPQQSGIFSSPKNQETLYLAPSLMEGQITRAQIREKASQLAVLPEKMESNLVAAKKLAKTAEQISPEKVRIQKTSPSQKIGETDSTKLPDSVREELKQKRRSGRSK